jgi:HlyD family secretion protein
LLKLPFMMDRAIPDSMLRRRRIRIWLRAGALLGAIAVAGALVGAWIQPSVRRGHVRTARVDRGPVDATVAATGVVVPLVEHVLTSPIDTRVVRIRKSPGAALAAGEAIVELDVGGARLAVSTLDDQIALKRNESQRADLELETTLADLRRRRAIKELELQSLQLEASRARTLFERGVYAEDAARKADTDVARARIELEQLDESAHAAERTFAARADGVALEIKILAKQRVEAAHVLEVATAATDRPGVLTWVIAGEGTSVRRGDPIARVADLSSFRVDATVSDVHAARLTAGMPATVRVGEAALPGSVGAVHPSVENGALAFEVQLDDPADARLRPNLRVEVHAVTASKPSALRIARGTFGAPDGSMCAFVVRGDRAVRTPIQLGIASFDAFEVIAGLVEGDEVIVSDTTDFMHHREVALR